MAPSSLAVNEPTENDDIKMAAASSLNVNEGTEKDDNATAADSEQLSITATDIPANLSNDSPKQALQAGEWSSPEDPGNPMNWSTAKKTYHSAIPSVYCFTVYVI